jgi:hypothetical protein
MNKYGIVGGNGLLYLFIVTYKAANGLISAAYRRIHIGTLTSGSS